MSKNKTIGVLTSGGDAPGMNAAVKAGGRTGIAYGCKVKGIQEGCPGIVGIYDSQGRKKEGF